MLSAKPPCDEGVIRGGLAAFPTRATSGRWVLVTTILGSSLAFIDGTVVNVALPVLQRDLGATAAEAQWVVEGYALFLSALLLVGGSLGDHFGRRRVFVIGIGIFAVASMLCGLSPNIEALIAARAVQGVGAALLTPGSLAILSASFDESERGRAIGTWSGFTAITAAVGPVLGGWLVEHASFRWIFFINLPIAIVVIVLSLTKLPESRAVMAGEHLDLRGAALATLGLGALVFGLIGLSAPQVASSAIAAVAIGAAVLAAFWVNERRHPFPMLPLDLFDSKVFLGVNLLTLVLYAALGGAMFFLPFNLIGVQGYSPTAAGAALLPFVVIMFALSRWAGGLIDRHGAKLPLVAGPLVTAVGFALFAVPSVGGSYVATFLAPTVVMGIGMAISVAPLTTVVMSSVPAERTGVASAVNNTVARTASLLAIALAGILLAATFSIHLTAGLAAAHLPERLQAELLSQRAKLLAIDLTGAPGELGVRVQSIINESFVYGFRAVMLSAAALAVGGACVAAWSMSSAGPSARG
jgi:EmrB/QacA subfamily drug resistance transporter